MIPSVMLMLNLEEVLMEDFSLNYQESQNKRSDPATSVSLPESCTFLYIQIRELLCRESLLRRACPHNQKLQPKSWHGKL